jgi:hypothetical protein
VRPEGALLSALQQPRESTAFARVANPGFFKKMKALGLRRSAADKESAHGSTGE